MSSIFLLKHIFLSFFSLFPQPPGQKRRIGFLANHHLMAYQGKENQVGAALDRVKEEFGRFREENTDVENEEAVFAVIGGDFNFDNVSPGN